jgi:hypothetical protein
MKYDEEITALALDYLNNQESVAAHIGDAFKDMPRAPLAQLIDAFLEMSPKINIAPLLKRIADTNQGRLEDLNIGAFQSYLIEKCGTNELELKRLIGTLDNFQRINASAMDPNKQVQIAARDESNSGQNSRKLGDLLKQIEKRER